MTEVGVETEPAAPAWAILALVLAVLCLYGRTVLFGFTEWDDRAYVLENPALQDAPAAGLQRLLTPGGVPDEPLYIPLTYLTFWAEKQAFGLRPGVCHATNTILHALNALLVYLLFRRFSHDWRVGLLTALLFALHPLQVESVAWVMGRKDVLSAFLSLACLTLYTGASDFAPSRRRYVGALLLFLAACLAKPTAIVLPGILLLADMAQRRGTGRRCVALAAPFLALAVVVFLLNPGGGAPMGGGPGLPRRLAFLPAVVTAWVRRVLLLLPPQVLYLNDQALLPARAAWSYWLVPLGLVAAVAAAIGRRAYAAWLAVAASALAFLPALRIAAFPMRDFITADRYGYMALIPVFWLAARLPRRLPPRGRPVGLALAMAVLATCFARSWRQVSAWESDGTLWTRELQVNPGNYIAALKLGNYRFYSKHDPAGAEHWYRESLRLKRDYAEGHNNLGNALLARGDEVGAAAAYSRAINIDPRFARAWYNRGLLYNRRGVLQAALRDTRRALELRPNDTDAHYNLGIIYEKQAKFGLAAEQYRAAIAAAPRNPDARYNLGLLLAQAGRHGEAEREFREVVRLKPQHAFAHYNLGVALEMRGDMDAAVASYRRATAAARDKPQPALCARLGAALVRAGDCETGLRQLRKAVQLAPDEGTYQQQLAEALQHCGRGDEAQIHRRRTRAPGSPPPSAPANR